MHQIEGAGSADGKGESIWDRFLHERPTMTGGDSACDRYHRLNEDLDLLADIGVNVYRFSTAWTRFIPDGDGDVNPAGFAFYDRLIEGLIARDIEPWLTLYHRDLPQVLQNAGGWPLQESVDWFARYTSVMVDDFGDRLSHWITINEPSVSSFLGHADGIFAPGLHNWPDALLTAHHQLLAHGEAARIIHRRDRRSSVGITLDCRPAVPLTDDHAEGPVGPSGADGYTEMGWKTDPDALGGFVRWVHTELQPDSIGIAENGASSSDGVGADGQVHDVRRIDYLSSHIDQVESLRTDGVPVDDYLLWRLPDNLEWTSGFDQRFVLIHVDHTTQRRTIKDSGCWYCDRIALGMGTPAG